MAIFMEIIVQIYCWTNLLV